MKGFALVLLVLCLISPICKAETLIVTIPKKVGSAKNACSPIHVNPSAMVDTVEHELICSRGIMVTPK